MQDVHMKLNPGLLCQRNIMEKKSLFASKLDYNLRKNCEILHLEHTFVGYWYLDTSYLESIEMWCWRRIKKFSWTDRVKNEEVLLRVGGKEYPTYNTQIGHILHRNWLLKLVFEGMMVGTGRRGRRRKPLLYETKKLQDTGSWRELGSAGYGLVVRQEYEMNDWKNERTREPIHNYQSV